MEVLFQFFKTKDVPSCPIGKQVWRRKGLNRPSAARLLAPSGCGKHVPHAKLNHTYLTTTSPATQSHHPISHQPPPPTMDFAPYQDTFPSTSRALSPPPTSRSPAKSPPPTRSAPPLLPPPTHFSNGDPESGRANINLFETSLPLRLDFEAMLAYLLLPPAGGVLLLVLERKSDYVRCGTLPHHPPAIDVTS